MTNYLNNSQSGTYGWVFGQIRVDPKNPDTIWILGVPLSKSTDGGRTFAAVGGMHGDHHGLWIDPANTNIIYNANDGGFYQTADAGKTWRFAVSAAGAQFYNVELDTSSPIWAYGSIQDHGSRRGTCGSRRTAATRSRRWRGKARPAAKARITPSIRRTRTSSTRTGSTAASPGPT